MSDVIDLQERLKKKREAEIDDALVEVELHLLHFLAKESEEEDE